VTTAQRLGPLVSALYYGQEITTPPTDQIQPELTEKSCADHLGLLSKRSRAESENYTRQDAQPLSNGTARVGANSQKARLYDKRTVAR
jgi:hypothetical protein